jgi:FlaG/FlaF family flagellin (archaellin)
METSLMTHEHETVVVERDRGGSGMGAVLGIIAIIVLLAAVWYFALGPGGGSSTTTNNNTTNNNNTVPTVTQPAAPAAS